MRRLLVAMVVAASAALVPMGAMAGNQEAAEQIAASLKQSGQMHGYKIGVKYQDGTAWLRGQVSSREQMDTALGIVRKAPGVTRVVNHLTIVGQEMATPAVPKPSPSGQRPLQPVDGAMAAEQLPRSVSREMRGPQMPRPVISSEVASLPPVMESPRPVNRADRVGTAVLPVPAPQVSMTGLQEPTLAPPQQAEPPQPVASPQMVVRTPPIAQPAVARAPVAQPAVTPAVPQSAVAMRASRPLPIAYTQAGAPTPAPAPAPTPVPQPAPHPAPQPMAPIPAGPGMVQYDHPNLPNYSWPGYSAYPNYAAVTYPKQYSPTAWPYIGPFYPYPQVPLGWRKVALEWHDGWWNLNFDDGASKGMFSGLFRPFRR